MSAIERLSCLIWGFPVPHAGNRCAGLCKSRRAAEPEKEMNFEIALEEHLYFCCGVFALEAEWTNLFSEGVGRELSGAMLTLIRRG